MTYPYIKVASWIKTLDELGKLDCFLGLGPQCRTIEDAGDSLEEFWRRFKYMHGSHEVYKLADEGRVNLRASVPVFLHGDEGTTYKKDACLCLSFHCGTGLGTSINKLGPLGDERLVEPHLNFLGNALETRFLLGSLLRAARLRTILKFLLLSIRMEVGAQSRVRYDFLRYLLHGKAKPEEDYRDDHQVMHDLLELVVTSLDSASRDGVPLTSGGTVFPIPVGNKGDWPYLVACQLIQSIFFGIFQGFTYSNLAR